LTTRSDWSFGAPAGYRFAREVISVAGRWYLRYGLSYRDVEEPLCERGIEVDHVTICRWVQTFTPRSIDAARAARHASGARWFVDETNVKVAGRWTYLCRAVDQHGQVIDVLVSRRRDGAAARAFFARALSWSGSGRGCDRSGAGVSAGARRTCPWRWSWPGAVREQPGGVRPCSPQGEASADAWHDDDQICAHDRGRSRVRAEPAPTPPTNSPPTSPPMIESGSRSAISRVTSDATFAPSPAIRPRSIRSTQQTPPQGLQHLRSRRVVAFVFRVAEDGVRLVVYRES
jgi:hypothetical protein